MKLVFMESRYNFILTFLSICVLSTYNLGLAKRKSINVKEFLAKEKMLLSGSDQCVMRSMTALSIYNTWHSDQMSSETHVCLLNYLENHQKDEIAWCMLGSIYSRQKAVKETNDCFQIASDLTGDMSVIDKWYFIGPFVIGKSEFDGDPLAIHGGIGNISRFRFSKLPPKYLSELATDGEISWMTIPNSKGDEYVTVVPKVDWNDLVRSLGSMGITEWQGWAVGQFVTTPAEETLSIQCLGVASCFVDGVRIAGDVYGRKDYWISVTLSRGVHQVFVPLRTKVAANFRVSVFKKKNFIVMGPTFLPQLYDGYLPKNTYLSIPISNQMGKKWLGINKVTLTDSSENISWKSSLINKDYRIAPGQVMHIIIKLSSSEIEQGQRLFPSCNKIGLELNIKTSDGMNTLGIDLDCRKRGSSFLFTFIDHDGSVQHAAAIEPLSTCSLHVCPILLSLHGTTVPPQNQADSYKRMVKGEFQFGVSNMWLLAPTRHGAHNWEGPGALTAMTAVDALNSMVHSNQWLSTKTDPNKILFAGHSMGGHGALHLATHFPDRAIGLLSLAGWIRKEDYGDSNLFFRHDISTSHADPVIKFMMESCVAENDVDKHVCNLKDIPVLLRIGAADRTVHPFFLRRMLRLMREEGVEVKYSELPKLEHWWWDTKETNDGGCMNDLEIRKFISEVYDRLSTKSNVKCSKDTESDCGMEESKSRYIITESNDKQSIKYVTYNPSFGGTLGGIKILQQIHPLQKSMIQMNVDGNSMTLTTRNIQCMDLTATFPTILWNNDAVVVDQTSINVSLGKTTSICRFESGWQVTDNIDELSRNALTYGPVGRIAENPFIIITGTQVNDSISIQLLTHSTYLANQFLLTSDSYVPIIKDIDAHKHLLEDKNLILVGNHEENSLTKSYLEKLKDLKFNNDLVKLGKTCQFKSSDVGIMSLAPHGKNRLALLLMGGSPSMLANIINLATPTIPPMARSPFSNLLPDFVITGLETQLKGPGGFECAGFWNNYWAYSVTSSSCVCH